MLICFIAFHETITGENKSIKTTPIAQAFIWLDQLFVKVRCMIKNVFHYLLGWLNHHRRLIFLAVVLVLIANGVLYRILVESIIFVVTYVILLINLETYLVIFSIFQAVFTYLYPKLKLIPFPLIVVILFILIFFKAIAKAEYRLKKNHERLKEFAKDELTQTPFINGLPGTGKTLLNVSLSLVSEENYIEELENKDGSLLMLYGIMTILYLWQH